MKTDRNQLLTKLGYVLSALLIFLVPTNLFLKLSTNNAYVNGLLVDYLIPKLYLVDVIAVLASAVFVIKQLLNDAESTPRFKFKNISTRTRLLISLGLLLSIRQALSSNPAAAYWFAAKIAITVTAAAGMKAADFFKTNWFKLSLTAALIFQALIAGYQFAAQTHLGGYLFLGEPNLSQWYNLAHGSLLGKRVLLAYGTTAHPNVLAGFSLIYFWLLTRQQQTSAGQKSKHGPALISISLFSLTAILFTTQSLSAVVAASLMAVVGLSSLIAHPPKTQEPKPTKLTSLTKIKLGITAGLMAAAPLALNQLPQEDHSSIFRRNYLNQAAVKMVGSQPLTGVGLNNYVENLERYTQRPEVVRFVQPAHHFILLWAAETGLLGGFLLFLAIYRLFTLCRQDCLANSLLIISPLLALDHYLLTLSTGQWSLILLLAWCCLETNRRTNHPAPNGAG